MQGVLLQRAFKDEAIVFGRLALRAAGFGLLQALAQGNGQRLAQLARAVFIEFAKGLAAAVVDDLEDAVQGAGVQDGRDQHLAGPVTGALVHFLEKTQRGVDFFQRIDVVNINNIEHPARQGYIAGNTLRADGQLQVVAGVQAGFDSGDDGAAVFADDIQRQPVGIEQPADVLADLKHDLRDVVGFVDPVGHPLQLPEIQGLKIGAPVLRRKPERVEKRGLVVVLLRYGAFNGCSQSSNSCPALSQRMSCGRRVADWLAEDSRCCISAMMRCVSAGLVWVM